MLRIGLTGGIASGKSTVANFFADLGADIVDTDQIARDLVAPGTPALARIVATFGPGIVGADGRLDRRRLRDIVFRDEAARRRLEAILHPAIRTEALARADRSAGPYVLLVVPLLFESGFDLIVDRTVCTDCPEDVQIARLMARDNVSRDDAIAALASQLPGSERKARADDVIDTGVDLGTTRQRVAKLHDLYLKLAENCPKVEGRAE